MLCTGVVTEVLRARGGALSSWGDLPLMKDAVEILRVEPNSELIWASPRELLNL